MGPGTHDFFHGYGMGKGLDTVLQGMSSNHTIVYILNLYPGILVSYPILS